MKNIILILTLILLALARCEAGIQVNDTNFANYFVGNGSLLTNLNASNLTSGTLPDAVVSPNTMTNWYGTNAGRAVYYVGNHTWAINTNTWGSVTAAGATFTGVDIPTNTSGTHGYTGYFTNGIFVSSGTY